MASRPIAPDSLGARSWFWNAADGGTIDKNKLPVPNPLRTPLALSPPPRSLSLRDSLFEQENALQQDNVWRLSADAATQTQSPPKTQPTETQTEDVAAAADLEDWNKLLWSQCEGLEKHICWLLQHIAEQDRRARHGLELLELRERQAALLSEQLARNTIERLKFETLAKVTLRKVQLVNEKLERTVLRCTNR